MEKASGEMDLEEWEILSDDGFLDFKQIDRKESASNPKGGVDMNYFICRSLPTRHRLETPPENSGVPSGRNKLVPVPICLDLMLERNPDQELVKDIGEAPTADYSASPTAVLEKIKDLDWVGDQDIISQVFFKKVKENEFVDMKMEMDSPRSTCSRGLWPPPPPPQIDLGTAAIQFEEEDEDFDQKPPKEVTTEQETGNKNQVSVSDVKGSGSWESGGLNIWRWSVTGIGALCSMGVAAATICIFIFGSQQRQKHHSQNQRIQFQIYDEDKGIKQVVQHATRFNHALSSVRGVPLARANITFGGYYDGP